MTVGTDELCRSESGAPCSVDPKVVVDLTTLLEAAGGDRGVLEELVSMFREDCPALMEQIRRAVANDNAPLLMSSAHTLMGLLGSLGAPKAYDLCVCLENMARTSNLVQAASVLEEMERAIFKLDEALVSLLSGGRPRT